MALGISGVTTHQSSWTVKGNEETEGSQVDLIIERKDGIVKKRQTINSVLITTFGLTYNEYSGDFQNVITLDDLFV